MYGYCKTLLVYQKKKSKIQIMDEHQNLVTKVVERLPRGGSYKGGRINILQSLGAWNVKKIMIREKKEKNMKW